MSAFAAAALLAAGAAGAGNPELGRAKSAPCAACHGQDGLGTAPNFPVLAGQYADYLVHALKQYRSGERENALMAPWVSDLSDADIADLAAYYSSLKGLQVPKR
ncbi:MAG TPA: cytochrome c [Gammaproteobacteria bacterium]|nr:cytochrome c [Gammaproteobacteria bacterium]